MTSVGYLTDAGIRRLKVRATALEATYGRRPQTSKEIWRNPQ